MFFFSQCAGIANTNESPGAPHTAGFLQMTVCTTDWLILEACTHTYPPYPARAELANWRGAATAESIEWFVEGQAFLRSCIMIRLLAHPLPLLSSQQNCLSFSVFLCVASRANWRERRRGWARSQIIWPRESLALYKLFFSCFACCS
jgi:hypothetical protein